MKKVLVFFNAQPVEVVDIAKSATTVKRICRDGREVDLRIMQAGIHSITGDHNEIYLAANREVTSAEIVSAANLLL